MITHIGDKSGLKNHRAVSTKERKVFTDKHVLNFLKTSAKPAYDAEGAFLGTAEKIHWNIERMSINVLNESLLNDNRYGPGNRPHWALNKTRFPNLIKALNEEPDMGIRKRVSSLYQALAG